MQRNSPRSHRRGSGVFSLPTAALLVVISLFALVLLIQAYGSFRAEPASSLSKDQLVQGQVFEQMDSRTTSNLTREEEMRRIQSWISSNDLNKYGDRKGTMYMGGTPLFNEMTGERMDYLDYMVEKFPSKPWLQN